MKVRAGTHYRCWVARVAALPFFDPWMREPGRGHRGTNLLFKRFASDRMNGASEERIPLEIAIPRPVILVVLALLMPY